jgi:hypothetical protein
MSGEGITIHGFDGLLERNGLKPHETFCHDFHSYRLPDDFGFRKPYITIYHDPLWENHLPGNIMYDFKREWYSDENDMGYEIINGVTYEIPAYFKRLPQRILKKTEGMVLTSSPPQYDKIMVDFLKTKKNGFTGGIVVELLTEEILRIHHEYPSPVERLFDED